MEHLSKIIEFVDGKRIAHRFKGLTIPVMEFNEALPIIKKLMAESFKHGKSFGQHLTADEYVTTIIGDLSKNEKERKPRRLTKRSRPKERIPNEEI